MDIHTNNHEAFPVFSRAWILSPPTGTKTLDALIQAHNELHGKASSTYVIAGTAPVFCWNVCTRPPGAPLLLAEGLA